MVYIISQILAVIADISFMLSVLSKKKSRMILFFLINDLLFALHYTLLKAYSGAIAISIEGLFMLFNFLVSERKRSLHVISYVFAQLLLILTAIFAFDGFISLLPIIYMSICIFAVTVHGIIFAKASAVIRNILCATYLFLITSYVGAIIESSLLIFSLIGLIKSVKNK